MCSGKNAGHKYRAVYHIYGKDGISKNICVILKDYMPVGWYIIIRSKCFVKGRKKG